MTDIARIIRVLRAENLHVDMAQAVEHLQRSGYAETWSNQAVATHLHAFNSKSGGTVDLNLPAALRDPGFRASIGGLGTPEAWNRLSLTNRTELLRKYDVQKAQTDAPSMQPKRADRMSPLEKMTHGRSATVNLTQSHHDKLRQELASLRNSTGGANNLNITMARAERIRRLERELGVAS
jgi:hypothetical protein